jgi:hypothetical protein
MIYNYLGRLVAPSRHDTFTVCQDVTKYLFSDDNISSDGALYSIRPRSLKRLVEFMMEVEEMSRICHLVPGASSLF